MWWGVGALAGALMARPAWRLTEREVAARAPALVVRRSAWLLGSAGMIGLCAVAAGRAQRPGEVPALIGFTAGMWVLAMIDWFTLQLPRRIVWAVVAWGVVTLGWLALFDGEPKGLGRCVLAALASTAVMWSARIVTRGGIGFGDVRLAIALGWFAGWRSWSTLGRVGIAAIVLNGVLALALVVGRGAKRSSAMPFGPALAVSGVVVLTL